MPHSTIWVLVANDSDAALSANCDGSSRLLRVLNQKADDDRADFAWELMSELYKGAKAGAFDGVVIIATPEILKELRRITLPEIRKLVLGEICRHRAEIQRLQQAIPYTMLAA